MFLLLFSSKPVYPLICVSCVAAERVAHAQNKSIAQEVCAYQCPRDVTHVHTWTAVTLEEWLYVHVSLFCAGRDTATDRFPVQRVLSIYLSTLPYLPIYCRLQSNRELCLEN
jgi:hypothetical protein